MLVVEHNLLNMTLFYENVINLRYLIVGKQVHSEAIIGPQNDALLKDDNWIKPRKLQL